MKGKALSLLMLMVSLLALVIHERTSRAQHDRGAVGHAPKKELTHSSVPAEGVRVRGFVGNPSGQAVPGALIFHQDPCGAWERLVRPSDAKGRFTLALKMPGIHRFYAREGGRLSFTRLGDLASLALAPDQVADTTLNLTMRDALTWRIHVRDEDSGAGIEGAEISLPRLLGASRFTNQDGDADLVLSQDVWELQLQAEGYQPRTLRLGPPSGASGEIDLTLQKGCELAGKVVDERGRPLEGATLNLTHDDWSQHLLTDAGGRYSVKGVPQGQVSLRITHPGFLAKQVIDFNWPAKSQNLVFALQPDTRAQTLIEGRVQDLFARPLAGASLAFVDGPQRDLFEAATDADGRFSLAVPPLNPERIYRLVVRAPGHAARVMPFQSGPGKANLVAVLDRGKSISGLVQDAKGDPIAGVTLETALERDGLVLPLSVALSDTQGRYFFDGVDGRVRIRVSAPGFLTKTVSTEPRDGEVLNVALQRQGWLVGQIRDARTKSPIRQFKLRLESSDAYSDSWLPDLPDHFVAFSSEDGRFLMPGPSIGRACRVRVIASGYPGKVVALTSRAELDPESDLITLSDLGRSLSGRVLVKDKGLAQVRITALVLKEHRDLLFPWDAFFQDTPHPYFKERRTTRSDGAGRFTLDGLPVLGDIALIFEADGYGLMMETIDSAMGRAGAQQALTVYLEPEGGIFCTFSRKRHADAVFLELRGVNTPQIQRRILLGPTTDYFEFERLPIGPYYLDLTTSDDQGGRIVLCSQFVESFSGQTTKIDMDERPAYSVSGQIAFAGGDRAAARLIMVPRGKQDPVLRAVANAQGEFRFDFVPRGEYDLLGLSPEPVHPEDMQSLLEEHANRMALTVNGNLELKLPFVGMGRIRGCAGANAKNWEIEIRGSGEKGQPIFRKAVPQGSGEFAVAHLPAGKYSVVALLDGDALVLVPLVKLNQGQDLNLGQLSYQTSGRLVVQVTGAESAKGAIQVQVFPQSEQAPALSEKVWSQGTRELALEGLSPTPVTMQASLRNEAAVLWPGRQDCRILPGKTATLSVRVVPVTRLRISYDQGDEVRDVRLINHKTGNALHCQWRDHLPNYPSDLAVAAHYNNTGAVANNLDSGTWQVEVSFRSGATKISRVQLSPGVVTQLQM